MRVDVANLFLTANFVCHRHGNLHAALTTNPRRSHNIVASSTNRTASVQDDTGTGEVHQLTHLVAVITKQLCGLALSADTANASKHHVT